MDPGMFHHLAESQFGNPPPPSNVSLQGRSTSLFTWRFLRLRRSTFIQQPSLAVTFRCSSEDAMFLRRNRFPPKRMTQKSINPAESALHRRRRRCLVKLLPKNPLLLHNFRTTTEFGKAKCQSITIARNTGDSLAKPQPQSEIRSVIVH